ncbi:hypothetical protein Micbo1qcDRAFT_229788 [Microdochium bolleyi]|uniref:Inhibitor I9 domain-containing protein n=1 Tax=Microdochium bolleyi TaxID=196109 RepID=A0A136JIR0_9PEZI|nr:hypothetical protein Micbo1qcDRAFT_229788 [Microdochium bolleyi]
MRFSTALTAVLAAASGALAVDAPSKNVIVSFPFDTPSNVVDNAMDEIRKAGGIITHEYKLIKGFAAKAPAKIFETTMSVWQSEFNAVVEEDQVMTTQQESGMGL